MNMSQDVKVAVIGLDCAAPELVFERFRDELPNLSRLMTEGAWGPLRSIHPPITVPAWACMMSGRDPGQLGLYGFRNRKDYSYGGYAIANAQALRDDRVWDILSRTGRKSVLLGVPQTYPVRPINGAVVADFLTPSTQSEYTYPPGLKAEVERVSGGYVLDVEGFRTDDKAALLERIYEKTRKHCAVARHLLTTQAWDFFMMVEMGVDRIHHGFWSFMDPAHRSYQKGNPFEHAIREYYRYLDGEVGAILDLLPHDTVVLVVSDHGAKRLDGGICFNEWLIQQGYLTLKDYPDRLTPIDKVQIDWTRTKAWGDGGYYGRLFLNVKGREPQGLVDPADYEQVRSRLIEQIAQMRDHQGNPLGSRAYRPQELYREVRGIAPDLIVYFGDLHWRSVGSIGSRSVYTFDNDTGPDEANHDWNGIFLLNQHGCRQAGFPPGPVSGLTLYDIAPLVLRLFDCQPPVV
ncbi:Type I phosphodiesterase / nucleotide pyrophosphatase [Candidatus Methylomirabilis lanthanidiphila]|uniref:Type I phosphodiesterase / nucleotide pyrophosphatase n=1 Tax=Candidatus Methylomirabilis lanthanidiphila TaxID=2211376 RepID=A0A564ZMT7_9BACT|nr:Type I phosphodiesterase / nucleotide pyrophosphatase [Candidatus Methylomirabilis lanthanidiphila]